jgi:hypothetical protein
MKKWIDPVKNHPAKESTMNTRGDFGEFTELMKKVVHKSDDPHPSVSPNAAHKPKHT